MPVRSQIKIGFRYIIAYRLMAQSIFLMFFVSLSFSQNTVSKSFSISCPSKAVGYGYTGEPWAVRCSWSFNASTRTVTVSAGSSYSATCSRTFVVDSGLTTPVLSSRSAFHFSSLSGTYSANGVINSCNCSAVASQNTLNGSGTVSCSSPANCNGTFSGTDFCSLSLSFQSPSLPPPPQNTVSKSFSISCPSKAVGYGYTGEPWAVRCSWSFNASTRTVTVSAGSSYSATCFHTFVVDSGLTTPVLSSRSAFHSSNLSGTYGNPPIGCSCTATASLGLASNSGNGSVSCSAPGSTICSGTFFGTDFCSLSLDFQPLAPPPLPQCSDFLLISTDECKDQQGLYFAATRDVEDQIIGNDTNVAIKCHPIGHQSANNTLIRPDGSECVNNMQGELFNCIICPFGFEAPPSNHSDCPSEPPAPPALKRSSPEKNPENEPKKKESDCDYSQQCKPQPFYDALGRRTNSSLETRRFLFDSKTSRTKAQERELGIVAPLKREILAGQCCVENFEVRLRGNINDPIIVLYDKIGVEVEFDATFYGEEYDSGCNPSCCEFKQESKGYIFKNDTNRVATTCKIDGEYVYYDSTAYVPDCYGRDCTHFDDREGYDDVSGSYEGTDSPGLRVEEGDVIDIRMEFNSYIKDMCNAYEVKDSLYWGFHLYGTVPDNLNRTLLGAINQ